jgi:hypothetical protein
MATSSGAGYLLNAQANNSFIAVNDLLAGGVDVYRMAAGVGGKAPIAPGTFFVPASEKAKSLLDKSAKSLGIDVTSIAKRPGGTMAKVNPMRIALWDTYGGSMPSGWVRWIMEQYHFPMKVIYSQEVDAGNLRKKYDAIVFVTRAIPQYSGEDNDPYRNFAPRIPKNDELPAEYRTHTGRITQEKSIPELKKFLEAGGDIITIGSSTNLAYHLGLPVKNALTEVTSSGQERPLPGEKYYIPGSVLRVNIDSTQQATWGLPTKTDVYFDASPVFNIAPDAIATGKVKPLAWFDSGKPLRSGWAWGQAYLKDGVAAFMAPIGAGKLYAFGPEITFRAQAQGTFKFLFNQLYETDGNSVADLTGK